MINYKVCMIKIMVVLILFCSSTLSISAQEWKWAKTIGEPDGTFHASGMAKLSNNEIAVLGIFTSPSIQIGNVILEGTPRYNPFVSIIDKAGNFKNSITFGGG